MITSNATFIEQQSPYYKLNESFCLNFEKFINERQGKTSGKFNAWSYVLHGKNTTPKPWILEYKKSTFTSDRSLISLKNKNLFVSVIWKTQTTDTKTFSIRRKHSTDNIVGIFNSNLKCLENHKNYILNAKNQSKTIQEVIKTVHPLLVSNEVFQISQKNGILNIELRTDLHYFNIFNQLTKLNL
ncbi:hypothetical protein [Winogradskyella sediminis]|uniref:hypothetical protein n=1 Tax=Winogradskyella sediminis TaxID=1382466 RepID=UPI003AA8DD33